MIWIGHLKEILKLTFWASALRQSERLMLETFVVESLNSGQVILSILLIKLKKSSTWSWSIFQPFSTDLLFASRRRLLCRRLVWFKRCCSREGKLNFHPFNLIIECKTSSLEEIALLTVSASLNQWICLGCINYNNNNSNNNNNNDNKAFIYTR